MLQIGTKAPSFEGVDQNGETHNLSQYQDSWILLYFYPRDSTPGCTEEACQLRDNFSDFEEINAVVIGVSPDSVQSHSRFATRHELPFTLISDPDKKIIADYGADGDVKRISYLIDPDGKIAKTYPSVKPSQHAQEVLEDLTKLQVQYSV
ncbi:peroxiredoxin [Candidatus Falkowbacteria bacterium HGW-Falkowbacteria-2]|uniref:thioredoxin-dependent peroxiredoxin n=1 Tax=Candidatus Falkowbacteria bacterium HGW-Falkowbacteria-2 TaxID=2013769 RepID=A0A2N2DX38_9BACT|nr:MAG: peroxiredoxin [Candidatus Falkowbacteria bacterium HGW-Falkowbacteria-2]